MDMVKVRLVFRSGQRKTVKVWRFSPNHIDCTTLKEVEENILQLYPNVMSRRLGLLMKYQDSDTDVHHKTNTTESFGELDPLNVSF